MREGLDAHHDDQERGAFMTNRSFDALAITSSVPFRVSITGPDLRGILETGIIPKRFVPHLHRALNEAPIEMIHRVIAEFDDAPEAIKRLRRIAAEVGAAERIETWLSG